MIVTTNSKNLHKILKEASIIEVISNFIEVNNNKALCPFHNDRNPSLHINPLNNLYYCFGCHSGGNCITFVNNYLKISTNESLKVIAKIIGVELLESSEVLWDSNEKLYVITKRYNESFINNLQDSHKNYLYQRGFLAKTIELYNCGYVGSDYEYLGCSQEDLIRVGLVSYTANRKVINLFSNRLVTPITDIRGTVLGWVGRTLKDYIKPKYVHTGDNSIFQKKVMPYGLNVLSDYKKLPRIIIVEGCYDVWRLRQLNYDAVSCLGTNLSALMFERLSAITNNLDICFDGDEAGYRGVLKAIIRNSEYINSHKKLRVILLPKGEDPDSYGWKHQENFIKALNNPISALEFLLKIVKNSNNLVMVDRAIAILKRLNGSLKLAFESELATCYSINLKELQKMTVINESITDQGYYAQNNRSYIDYPLKIVLMHLLKFPQRTYQEFLKYTNYGSYNHLIESLKYSFDSTVLLTILSEKYDDRLLNNLLQETNYRNDFIESEFVLACPKLFKT